MVSQHRVIFRFDGRLAERGDLDGSDAEHFTSGARRLLAIQAGFFTTGKAPTSAVARTERYHVIRSTRSRGSVIDPWTIAIVGGAAGSVFGHYSIKAKDYTFANFAKESLGSCLSGKCSVPPTLARIEPSLSRSDRGNAEIFEAEQIDPAQIELLRLYTRRSLLDVMSPLDAAQQHSKYS